MTRLPRILSSLLLLAGGLAWLLGPVAPAQPRGAAASGAADRSEGRPLAGEVWLEGEVEGPEEAAYPVEPSEPAADAWAARGPVTAAPEAPRVDAPQDPEPASPRAESPLDLVRRMLALRARMVER